MDLSNNEKRKDYEIVNIQEIEAPSSMNDREDASYD